MGDPSPVRLNPVRLVSVGLAILVATSAWALTPAVGHADPLSDADRTVEELRREADRASKAYFDALTTYETLEAQIADLELRLVELRARVTQLRRQVENRAVVAYVHRGQDLSSIIASEDGATAARRTHWLARLNASDDAVIAELDQARQTLDTQRQQLDEARAQQSTALEQVRARGRDIDAKLRAAVQRRQKLQADAAAKAVKATAATASSTPPTSAPPAPPSNYQPTPGTHPQHDDPFLVCTRARESGGNYGAYNGGGPYMGAYQFLQSTWNSGANHMGRPELIGVPPHTASQYDQDDVTWAIYQWRGTGPWGGHCA